MSKDALKKLTKGASRLIQQKPCHGRRGFDPCISDCRPAKRNMLLVITTVVMLGLLAWDASFLDMALAQAMGGRDGFALRDNWFLTHLLHDSARRGVWAFALGLCLAVWWPIGPLRRLDFNGRLQLALTTLCVTFAISALKSFSTSSCPWELSNFGGIARYASHWSLLPDGGSGRCFPAGHASSGFAFIGGYFSFRTVAPRIGRVWLCCSIGAGFLFGLAQQFRGAHFMSHTLWTGFICWSIALAIDSLRVRFGAEGA